MNVSIDIATRITDLEHHGGASVGPDTSTAGQSIEHVILQKDIEIEKLKAAIAELNQRKIKTTTSDLSSQNSSNKSNNNLHKGKDMLAKPKPSIMTVPSTEKLHE